MVAVDGYLINSWQTCTGHSASKENGGLNCTATVEPTTSNYLELLKSSSGISVCTVSSAAIPRFVSAGHRRALGGCVNSKACGWALLSVPVSTGTK